ncbi:carboxylate-amine ligase [Kitasatospora sp. LaBMicrA B282]|uniref:carboxylate-amine ligase n=1 Tax=Kitasatospora sp. LaBMicrA B282 TaxID=3420949 RepID=UPI003D1241A8
MTEDVRVADGGRVLLPTVGVEEEFLLVDRRCGVPRGAAPLVLKLAREVLGDRVGVELFTDMVETRTRPVADLDSLGCELAELRAALAAAAAEVDCLVLPSGTAPVPVPGGPELTEEERYQRIATALGPLVTAAGGAGVCGCHIHLGVADRDLAVRLGARLRPWLPTVQAMAANSPFHLGRDTGYASWRSMRWGQLPGVAPLPACADAAEYDRLVEQLVQTGVLTDRRMAHWHCRPSEQWPTLEVRVADVCVEPETVLLLAALLRALAAVLLAEEARGEPVPQVADVVLRAAHWRAARDGLTGCGVDLVEGRLRPAGELVERLLARTAPALAATGELARVRELWARLRATGGGAARQRAAFARHGELMDVVGELALR